MFSCPEQKTRASGFPHAGLFLGEKMLEKPNEKSSPKGKSWAGVCARRQGGGCQDVAFFFLSL